MRHGPVLVEAAGGVGDGGALEGVMGSDHGCLPGHVTVPERLPEGERFDLDPGPGEVGEVGHGEFPYAEAALGGRHQEPLPGQAGEGLADDREAGVEALREVEQLEPLARLEVPVEVEKLAPQLVVDLFRARGHTTIYR